MIQKEIINFLEVNNKCDDKPIRFEHFEKEFFNRRKILMLANKRNFNHVFESNTNDKSDYLRSSQINIKCEKNIILSKLLDNNFPLNDNVNPFYQDSANSGNYLHDILQNDLINCGYIPLPFENNIELYFHDEKLHITGHVDFITKNSLLFPEYEFQRDYFIVGEIKTVDDKKFKNILKTNEIPDKYKEQNNMYIHQISKLFNENIFNTLFIFKNRSDNKEVCFLYRRSVNTLSNSITKCERLISYFENKIIPASEKTFDNCFFCRHSNALCDRINNYEDYIKIKKVLKIK